jgi:hypothetical protein
MKPNPLTFFIDYNIEINYLTLYMGMCGTGIRNQWLSSKEISEYATSLLQKNKDSLDPYHILASYNDNRENEMREYLEDLAEDKLLLENIENQKWAIFNLYYTYSNFKGDIVDVHETNEIFRIYPLLDKPDYLNVRYELYNHTEYSFSVKNYIQSEALKLSKSQ